MIEVGTNGAIKLSTLDNNYLKVSVNGSNLKLYKERGETFHINSLEIKGHKRHLYRGRKNYLEDIKGKIGKRGKQKAIKKCEEDKPSP